MSFWMLGHKRRDNRCVGAVLVNLPWRPVVGNSMEICWSRYAVGVQYRQMIGLFAIVPNAGEVQMTVHNMSFLVLGIVSLILQGIGFALIREYRSEETGILLLILAPVLMAIAASFYSTGKKRAILWGFLGLLSPVGLLFLALLEDRSAQVGPGDAA